MLSGRQSQNLQVAISPPFMKMSASFGLSILITLVKSLIEKSLRIYSLLDKRRLSTSWEGGAFLC
jgi:hypothetical protein